MEHFKQVFGSGNSDLAKIQPLKIGNPQISGCEDRVAIFAGEDRELLADRGRSRNWYY